MVDLLQSSSMDAGQFKFHIKGVKMLDFSLPVEIKSSLSVSNAKNSHQIRNHIPVWDIVTQRKKCTKNKVMTDDRNGHAQVGIRTEKHCRDSNALQPH